jgi:flavin-binding protein dodecin
MSNHTYRKIELVGSSTISIEDAVRSAVSKATSSEKNLRWLEVVETRAHLEDGRVAHWQVTVKVGATLE